MRLGDFCACDRNTQCYLTQRVAAAPSLPVCRYAVFAAVEDEASFAVVDAIAAAVLGGAKPLEASVTLV